MQDGRVSFTAEKATPEFYQLSGRRINWDLTDYHPLLAQRATSTDTFSADLQPSVGYQQATEIREALDRNFLFILSDAGARGGGGALATFNRSIGPFEADRTEVTFLRAVVIVDPAATGKDGTIGVYRSPFSLPNGDILASYAANVSEPDVGHAEVRPGRGQRAHRGAPPAGQRRGAVVRRGGAGLQARRDDAVPQRAAAGVRRAHVPDADSTAIMHFPDAPMLATLLGANLRRGRNVAAMDKAVALKVYEESHLPAPTRAA